MKQLKKYSWLLLVLLTMVMAAPACSDDKDDKDKNPNNSLVGTWIYMDSEDSERITFNANGTGTHYYSGSWGSDAETFRWTATENTVTLNYEDDSDPWIARYSISADGKQLTLDGEVYFRQ